MVPGVINSHTSNQCPMKMIIQIVESEDKSSPLSDENIKINLKEKFKIEIARRTVTKYRKEANLLTSKQRLIL